MGRVQKGSHERVRDVRRVGWHLRTLHKEGSGGNSWMVFGGGWKSRGGGEELTKWRYCR